ncbi:MAG TPA: hypothetical protein EYP14_04100, partial [Planctomycetaceae bacterium]|nr:hypothetical protein [Planctomycetaceae bacterium]
MLVAPGGVAGCEFVTASGAGKAAGSLLPRGVEAEWDLSAAYREATGTRERGCINGLWQWQPAQMTAAGVPSGQWGYFKVPGCWPGITSYMQKDCQRLFAHPGWRDVSLGSVKAAWYQRRITVPDGWRGRRIVLAVEYLNSFATVYVDGRRAGELRFPAGELDLTELCQPGGTHTLSLHVVALPLKAIMLSYRDTASAKKVAGRVDRRGLCGDVWLLGLPSGPCIKDVKIDTSVRQWRIRFDVALDRLLPGRSYKLKAVVKDGGRVVRVFVSPAFDRRQLKHGRFAFAAYWHPQKLWDIHTPRNMYRAELCLLDADGGLVDAAFPERFGFREFWIDGRDFYLNGTRIFLCAVPLDNAQVGAAWATYKAARESLLRLKSFGINFVYTHNYGCQPGDHLSFKEILDAADEVGMLVALSQPHFAHYDWSAAGAERTNGYAQHAAFYVRVA